MRISPKQVDAVHQLLKTIWGAIPYKLYLYGSRVHDHLKGGDIDLLIVTSDEGVNLFEASKLGLLVQLKKHPLIGQRQIDLRAVTEQGLQTEAFLQEIAKTMIGLKSE